MIKKLAVSLALLFITLSFSACSTPSTPTSGTGTDTAPSSSPKAQTEFAIGEPVSYDDLGIEIVVNSVREDSGGQYLKPEGVYYIINATITNKSDKDFASSTVIDMYLKDSEGTKYSVTFGPELTGSLDGSIPAGEKQKGDICFDIPKDATDLYFYYAPSLVGSKAAKIKLDR